MIYELRIYRTLPGRLPALLARFETHTLRIGSGSAYARLGSGQRSWENRATI